MESFEYFASHRISHFIVYCIVTCHWLIVLCNSTIIQLFSMIQSTSKCIHTSQHNRPCSYDEQLVAQQIQQYMKWNCRLGIIHIHAHHSICSAFYHIFSKTIQKMHKIFESKVYEIRLMAGDWN